MITSRIISENGKQLKIGSEGEISVSIKQHPPLDGGIVALPFRQYFTSDGTAAGSNDMIVDGSTIPVEFWIPAEPNFDRFIKFISIKLSDPAASLDKFGNLSALTNGVEFEWQSQSAGSLVIHDGLKDNLEFFRLTEMTPVITDLSGGGADAITVTWDLAKIFGYQWGLKLSQGTTEKLIFRVNDALSGLAEFNVIGHGTKV